MTALMDQAVTYCSGGEYDGRLSMALFCLHTDFASEFALEYRAEQLLLYLSFQLTQNCFPFTSSRVPAYCEDFHDHRTHRRRVW